MARILAPPGRMPRRTAPADGDLAVLGGLAAAIVLLAALALAFAWRGFAHRGSAPVHASEAIGVALAPADGHPVVDSLRGDGAAARAGLRVGDRLEAVDGSPVSTVAAADARLRARAVDIRVRRGQEVVDLHLAATRGPTLGP